MGVGETTYGSFRRGFGEGSVLGLMSDIVDELMLKHPKEFREYLEGSWVYQRNEVNESGEYHKVEVEIRRGDLLEKLFQGYDLQAMTGRLREFPKIIRGFRLGEKNEAILMRRMQQAWEDYQFDGEMDVDDARLIAEQMSLWYLSPGIKAKKGDRWYLFEQWLKSKTDGGELLFDGVFEVVEEYL